MQRTNKCKSTKSSQGNLSRSEVSGSCSTTNENNFPAKITPHVKVLLKAGSGCQMCEICREITGYTIVEIEQERPLGRCTQCTSKDLHVLCDICLASILSQNSGKSDALKDYTGREVPCNSNTCEFSNSEKVEIKEDESNTCRASCNTKTHTKMTPVISKLPNIVTPVKPHEISFVRCNQKSNTVPKKPLYEPKICRKLRGGDSKNNIKSPEKKESKSPKTKSKTICGDTTCNKKTIDQKNSRVTDAKQLEIQRVSPLSPALDLKETSHKKAFIMSELFQVECDTSSSGSIQTIRTIDLDDNFEISSNKTEYGVMTDDTSEFENGSEKSFSKECKILPEHSIDARNTAEGCENSSSYHCQKASCSKFDDNEILSVRDSHLTSCATCEPCYPSAQECIATMELHCIECSEPDKIKCENCLNGNHENSNTSNRLESIPSNRVKKEIDANEAEMMNNEQSLICTTCEPCYPSVQESIEGMELHCVECADPDKIKCENCLNGDHENNNTSSALESVPSNRIKEEIDANEAEMMNNEQSLICTTCEPCYPSVQESIEGMELHCVECADPDKIKCENCLNGDHENNNTSSALESVPSNRIKEEIDANEAEMMNNEQSLICTTCEPCYPSVQESIEGMELHCVECADPDKIKCENCLNGDHENNNTSSALESVPSNRIKEEIDANEAEMMNNEQSLICTTCEPCYPSVQESIEGMELHCVECADPDKIKCENCLNGDHENNNTSSALESVPSNRIKEEIDANEAEMMNNEQSLICTTCEPCYPSVQESIAGMELHCVECADPDKIKCENCLNGDHENNNTSSALESVPSNRIKEEIDANEAEMMNNEQSLICTTCEPCYPSVQESIAGMELHCVECAEPDKIKCENCLNGNNDDNQIDANVTEVNNKQQSLTICTTCEQCYPSVQESIAAMVLHCVECAELDKIECERCLIIRDNGHNVASSSTNIPSSCNQIKTQTDANKTREKSINICATCKPCEETIHESMEFHCNECNEPDKIKCDNCLTDKDQLITICAACEPCNPAVHTSFEALELHCIECAEPSKIECENCLSGNYENRPSPKSEVQSKISKAIVEEDMSTDDCRYTTGCECEDVKTINTAYDQTKQNKANNLGVDKDEYLMSCSTCEPCHQSLQESIAGMELHCVECADPDKIECESCSNNKSSPGYANVSTKVSYAQSNKEIQCQHPELSSINSRIPNGGCQSHECCVCDEDDKPEVMKNKYSSTVCVYCEACKQSMDERNSSSEFHCLECSNTNEILCDSCSNIVNKHDDGVTDLKTDPNAKCSDCQNNEDTESKKSEILLETNCKTCEQCEDDFSETSRKNHCITCKDISDMPCKSCLEIENKKSNGNFNDKLDDRLIYELVCETCKQLCGKNSCFDEECTSIERHKEASDICICKIGDDVEEMRNEQNPSHVTDCNVCSTCKNLIGYNSFEAAQAKKQCMECADVDKIQCGVCTDKINEKDSQIAKAISNPSSNTNTCRDNICAEREYKTTNNLNVKCSTCGNYNETNCGDCKTNKKIINQYFGQQQSTNLKAESKVSEARGMNKYTESSKLSVDSVSCTGKDCPNYRQPIPKSSLFDKSTREEDFNFGSIYCETCGGCENDSFLKEHEQQKEHCLDCIDINDILCESCLKLANEQNSIDTRSCTSAGIKNQSIKESQQQSKNLLAFNGYCKENASKNKYENYTCTCTKEWPPEQNVRKDEAKEEMAIEKHSAITDGTTCICNGDALASSQHKLEGTLACSCSFCAEKNPIELQEASYSPIQKHQEQVTRCCNEPECVRCGQSKTMSEPYEVISLSMTVSDTSTGEYSSRSFVGNEIDIESCSRQNVVELDGVVLSNICRCTHDRKSIKSKPKCSCHISTNTSKPINNNGSVHIRKITDSFRECQANSSRECPKCNGASNEVVQREKIANSPKGECGTALKYKLSCDDRASDYVLLDGPIFIKKSCMDGKQKVCKSTSGTPVRDVGDSSAHASHMQAVRRFRQCRECCRYPGCAMPELKHLCVLEPEIISKYRQLYHPDQLPRRQEEDDFDPTSEYVPYLVHTHGNPPSEDKYHFLMMDMECYVQSKDIINQDVSKRQDGPEITIDLKLLEKQISLSDERPHSILVKEVTRDDEDDISSHKDKISINWDPEVEDAERRRPSLMSNRRRISLLGSNEMEWEQGNDTIQGKDEFDMMFETASLSGKRRQSLLKDTILDQVVREQKRRESLLPEQQEREAQLSEPPSESEPQHPEKRKFSLSLFKRNKRKKKLTKTSSDVRKGKHEESDSESSDDSSRENIKSRSSNKSRRSNNVSSKIE